MKNDAMVWKIVKQYKGYLLLSIGFIVILTVVNLIPPILIDQFIDLSVAKTGQSTYERILIRYAVVIVVIYLSANAKNFMIRVTAWKMSDQIREVLFIKCISQGQNFYNKYSSAAIIEHLENDVDTIESIFVGTLIPVVINALTLAGVLIIFFRNSIAVGLIFTTFIIITFATIYYLQKAESSCISEERESSTKLSVF